MNKFAAGVVCGAALGVLVIAGYIAFVLSGAMEPVISEVGDTPDPPTTPQ